MADLVGNLVHVRKINDGVTVGVEISFDSVGMACDKIERNIIGAAILDKFFDPLHACRCGAADFIIGIYIFNGTRGTFVKSKISIDIFVFRKEIFVIRFVPDFKIPFFDFFLAVSVSDVAYECID